MVISTVSNITAAILAWSAHRVRSLFQVVVALMPLETDTTCNILCAPTVCASLAPVPLRSASGNPTATPASANSLAKKVLSLAVHAHGLSYISLLTPIFY